MKISRILLLAASSLLFASTAIAETVTIDDDRSSLTFTSDAPGERIVGTAEGITGTIETDLSNLTATTGTIEVPVENMETGNQLRDRHMRGEDWLNAEEHPNIIFTIESIEETSSETDGDITRMTGVAVGTINVNGVDAPVRADVEVAVNMSTQTVRVQPAFSIALADHNVAGRDNAIGDTVGTEIEIEGTVYGGWE